MSKPSSPKSKSRRKQEPKPSLASQEDAVFLSGSEFRSMFGAESGSGFGSVSGAEAGAGAGSASGSASRPASGSASGSASKADSGSRVGSRLKLEPEPESELEPELELDADAEPVAEYMASPEAEGQRLDAWLTTQLTELSRSRVRLLFDEARVTVDGLKERPSYKLRGGEAVVVRGAAAPPPLRAMAEDIPLEIIYEDRDLIVVNKPAGMMVHAGSGATDSARNRGTLVNALLGRAEKLSQAGGELRPGIVHRLDKETSGLILVARNDATHLRLAEMFAEREIHKTYTALVHGHLAEDRGTINAAIARDVIRRTRMTTRRTEGARSAISHYRVVERIDSAWGRFTLVSVKIETGRTHQIRVHLSSIGHPVVGDTHYGAPATIVPPAFYRSTRPKHEPRPEGLSLARNFLHAAELKLAHPRTEKPLHLMAPLPEELIRFLEQLKPPSPPSAKR